jgi:hypothetical protein
VVAVCNDRQFVEGVPLSRAPRAEGSSDGASIGRGAPPA